MKKIQGLVAATFTPMNDDFSIAPDLAPAQVEHALKSGINGLFVVGSTGEFPSLLSAERKIMVETFIQSANKRLPVIVNVGSCSIQEACDLAAHAAGNGADAICAMVPFYFRPGNARVLADCVKEIARHCEGKPLYLYHVPCMTKAFLDMYEFLAIMEQECENFAGVKYTDEDLCTFQRCIERYDGRFQMLYGRDEILLSAFAVGAEAGVGSTYAFMPRVYTGLLAAYAKGNLEEARRLQGISQAVIAYLPRYGGLAAQKYFMEIAGVKTGPTRLPVPALDETAKTSLRRELKLSGLESWIG